MPIFSYLGGNNPEFSDFLDQFSQNEKSFLRDYITSQNIAQKIKVSLKKPTSRIGSISLMWYGKDKWDEIGHYTERDGTALKTPSPHYPHHLAQLILSARKLEKFGKVTVDGVPLSEQLIEELWERVKKETDQIYNLSAKSIEEDGNVSSLGKFIALEKLLEEKKDYLYELKFETR